MSFPDPNSPPEEPPAILSRGRWLVWTLLLCVPVLLLLIAYGAGSGSSIDRFVRMVFAPFCHQQPERSLMGGATLAVCSRCAGFYLGLAAGGVLAAGWRWVFGRRQIPRAALLGLIPLAIDGTGNLLGMWATPGGWRALTGLLAALPLAFLVVGGRDALER